MEEAKVLDLIQSVLEAENLTQGIVRIKNANVEIADGLMSEILRVSIKCDNTNKELNLIIKIAPTDPEHYKIVKYLYKSEIYFYDTIVPIFNDLQLKHTGKPFDFIPRFFKATKEALNEKIILEDLSFKGYKMLNRKHCFNDETLKLVLKQFGKFHALSFALQKHNIAQWNSLNNEVDQSEVFTGEVIDWFCDALKKCYILFESIKPEISNKVKLLHDHFEDVMKKLLIPSTKYPSAIVHIDPWCNNLLFKHFDSSEGNDTNKTKDITIEDVVLIDFQQACKGSPVLDISCFLYINATVDAINRWHEYLQVYYQSLCEHGEALNCCIQDVYSWEMFLDDWKEYAKYGILKSVMGISLNTQEQTDEEKEPLNVINNDESKSKLSVDFYVEKWNLKTVDRIKGLILHANKEDLL